MIIINTPHNPTGAVLQKSDLLELQKITDGTDILVLSDEVYEHLIFDGIRHESVCWYPELAKRSYVVGSFGKTFHATGWKTGFILAPHDLMVEVRKVHQFVTFASNTPVQYALAEFIKDKTHYDYVPTFYQQKRDFFVNALQGSRFQIIPCHGTYFQLLNYEGISDENELDFAIRLTKEFGVATVPVSPFYHDKQSNKMLRVCFAKGEETLSKAAEILKSI
jgi:methionine aminotransferase